MCAKKLDENWYTEIHADAGSAFSLEITGKIHDETTPFQHLEVYETARFGRLMTLDGLVMLTARDNFLYHEMMTHPALFTHPDPKRAIIIGGGDCGCLHEVLKHRNITRCDQVEIDEAVTRAAEKYFPELTRSNGDPRASLKFIDGIRWMGETAPGSYDVVIVDSTDPIGPAVGLFTEEFYRDCHRALGTDGILAVQSESPLLHEEIIRSVRGAMRTAGFAHVHTLCFPQPVYPSGWWTLTLGSKRVDPRAFRKDAARDRGFPTRYYNEDVHAGALAVPEFLK